MDYMELVAGLPLPKPEQSARFADQVARNHSWYKHLPFFPPGASFVFFLNPNAGKGVKASGGTFKLYNIKSGDYVQHHSRLATAEYLDRFGHWDYWVYENPRRLMQQPEEPRIYGVGDEGCLLLPSEIKQRWSCRFTAFLKPGPILSPHTFDQEREAFLQYARQHPTNPDVERYGRFAREVGTIQGQDWGNKVLASFFEVEMVAQKERLFQTLQMIRGEVQAARSTDPQAQGWGNLALRSCVEGQTVGQKERFLQALKKTFEGVEVARSTDPQGEPVKQDSPAPAAPTKAAKAKPWWRFW
jgi:hypothetical protein